MFRPARTATSTMAPVDVARNVVGACGADEATTAVVGGAAGMGARSLAYRDARRSTVALARSLIVAAGRPSIALIAASRGLMSRTSGTGRSQGSRRLAFSA